MSRFFICAIAATLLISLAFLVAKKIKRYDLVDAAWGLAFIAVAITSYMLQPGRVFEWDIQTVVTCLVILWGSRLSWHILKRIQQTNFEDPRYVAIRKKWKGNESLNVFLRIYLVQAILVLAISIPVIHINLFSDVAWSDFASVGVFVWLVGFVFETISDAQLQTFVSNQKNKGKIMTSGLWRYSRHPNYFGELTQWWGIFIIALGTMYGWVGIIGPVLLSYLIICISGIPLNEKRFKDREGWMAYKKRTSVLFPLPVRVKE